MTLFAWVFALAAGAANACAVEQPGPAPQGHETHRHTHGVHESAGHDHPIEHEHPQDAGKAGCQKFCDDESCALFKSANPGFDQIPAHALVDGFKIQPVPMADVRGRLSFELPGAPGPPLVIRLRRLIL